MVPNTGMPKRGAVLTLDTDLQDGEALIQPVMRDGRRLAPSPPASAVREHVADQLTRLPPTLRGLAPAPDYPVEVTDALRALATEIDSHPT